MQIQSTSENGSLNKFHEFALVGNSLVLDGQLYEYSNDAAANQNLQELLTHKASINEIFLQTLKFQLSKEKHQLSSLKLKHLMVTEKATRDKAQLNEQQVKQKELSAELEEVSNAIQTNIETILDRYAAKTPGVFAQLTSVEKRVRSFEIKQDKAVYAKKALADLSKAQHVLIGNQTKVQKALESELFKCIENAPTAQSEIAPPPKSGVDLTFIAALKKGLVQNKPLMEFFETERRAAEVTKQTLQQQVKDEKQTLRTIKQNHLIEWNRVRSQHKIACDALSQMEVLEKQLQELIFQNLQLIEEIYQEIPGNNYEEWHAAVTSKIDGMQETPERADEVINEGKATYQALVKTTQELESNFLFKAKEQSEEVDRSYVHFMASCREDQDQVDCYMQILAQSRANMQLMQAAINS